MASGHVNRANRPNTWLLRLPPPQMRTSAEVRRLQVGKGFLHNDPNALQNAETAKLTA
jgi:hypothetical protein